MSVIQGNISGRTVNQSSARRATSLGPAAKNGARSPHAPFRIGVDVTLS
jgi:hypothetical protein